MKNVIVDIETLGNGEECDTFIILDVAWAFFEIDGSDEFDDVVQRSKRVKFDVDEQREMGWIAERGTLAWWKEQDENALKAIRPSPDDKLLADFVKSFNADLLKYKPKRMWSRGTDFDLPIVKRIYRSQGESINSKIRYNAATDVRTALNAMTFFDLKYDGFIPPKGKNVNFIKHNAKHDIAMDVLRIQCLADVK